MLLNLTDNIFETLDERSPKFVILLSLDIRKAFDSVYHPLLISKLETNFHFTESATNLMSSYIFNRSQCVKIGNKFSKYKKINSGVPQGSILGPSSSTLWLMIY